MIDQLRRLTKNLLQRGPASGESSIGGELKRNMPLVPADSIAGRALVTVIAIMTFLAAFIAGLGVLIYTASHEWTESISQEMTIQVRPSPNRDIEAEVKKAAGLAQSMPGVSNVRIFGKNESDKLLEPWLGAGLDLGELPIPRLIILDLSKTPKLDTAKLKQALREQTPTASLDDHRIWMERLAAMARSMVIVVAIILALVLLAMALAISFATRGAMAGNKGIVDVLHFVGAADKFIAREFQRHFLRLGLRGGAIGAGLAIATFLVFEWLSKLWTQSPGGDQIEALLGTFSLNAMGYVTILVIGLGIALLTGTVSRIIVFRHLRGLD